MANKGLWTSLVGKRNRVRVFFALSVELMFSCEMFFRALRSRCDFIFGRFLPLSFFERERIYFGLFALEFFWRDRLSLSFVSQRF